MEPVVLYLSDGWRKEAEPPLLVYDTRGNDDLKRCIDEYEKGNLDTAGIASGIIEALFDKDFVGSGKHWDRDGSSCSRIDDDTGNGEYVAYKCSCSATWDWKDIYSVATSKATIRVFVNRPLIHVVGYKYYVAG